MKKKILVVGGTGFIGFHFIKFCLSKNFDVYSISRKKPKSIRYLNKVNYILADISKKKKLYKILREIKNIDYVINFGGEVNHTKKIETTNSHFLGLKNLADFFFKKKILRFIQIGSSLEYGNCKSPQKETYKLKPNSVYSRAKAKSSKYILKLNKKNSKTFVIVRPYQVYGPYQDLNRFIPFTISNCLRNLTFPCSNGFQYRDFIYIDDFINYLFILLKKRKLKDQIYNIGSGKALKIRSVINLIKSKIENGRPDFGKIKIRKDENMVTFPSIIRIKKITNFNPKFSFEEGLDRTINFYKKNKI